MKLFSKDVFDDGVSDRFFLVRFHALSHALSLLSIGGLSVDP